MSSFNIFSILWIAVAVIIFFLLFFVVAPYGRHIQDGWGPKISARLGWVLMESPCVVLMLVLAMGTWKSLNVVQFIFLSIWLTHYVHRTFIWPYKVNMTGKEMPLMIAVSAFFFNIINVSLQGYWIFYYASYALDWLESPAFIIGICIFIAGLYICAALDGYGMNSMLQLTSNNPRQNCLSRFRIFFEFFFIPFMVSDSSWK